MDALFLKHIFQYVGFVSVHQEAAHDGPGHVNDDSHLLHITAGDGEIVLDERRRHILRRGVVVAIPRGATYRMRITAGFEMLNIHYRLWLADNRYLDDWLRLPEAFTPDDFDDLEETLNRMVKNKGESDEDVLPRRAVLSHQVVLRHLARELLSPARPHERDEHIEAVARHLREQLNEPFDSEQLARQACLSRSQLNRRFRRIFHLSPHQYWERHRLRAVCRQLRQTEAPLSAIAKEFGFSSPYYFSRWFRKNLACCPTTFRQSQGAL